MGSMRQHACLLYRMGGPESQPWSGPESQPWSGPESKPWSGLESGPWMCLGGLLEPSSLT